MKRNEHDMLEAIQMVAKALKTITQTLGALQDEVSLLKEQAEHLGKVSTRVLNEPDTEE